MTTKIWLVNDLFDSCVFEGSNGQDPLCVPKWYRALIEFDIGEEVMFKLKVGEEVMFKYEIREKVVFKFEVGGNVTYFESGEREWFFCM